MRQRTILHLDVDAFFASVEQLLDPALAGRPVIVGGLPGERCVVASCSYPARERGVHSGMALAEAHRLCPDGVFLRGDYQHYRLVQERIHEILLRYSPAVEFTSLDDAYLDLTGLETLHGPPLATATAIRLAIASRTGVSVTIGIGTSKLAARLASGCAKPAGILELFPGYERTFLREIEVERLPGVGRRTRRTLEDLNILTIGALARLPGGLLEAVFGKHGRTLWERSRAVDGRPVRERRIPLAISRETTFPEETGEPKEVQSMLHYLVERAAAHARRRKLLVRIVEVKLRFADFEAASSRRSLPRGPTDVTGDIYGLAREILDRLLTRRVRVRMVGATLRGLEPRPSWRQLFLPLPSTKISRGAKDLSAGDLDEVVDRIRERFGFGALTVGRSIDMLGRVKHDARGFVLRTPALTR